MRRRASAAGAASTATRKRFDGLGEGRSKPIYIRPQCTDTAILMAFYNPARYRRSLKNILYLISVFKTYGIPYFVAECTFGSYRPQIPGATLVLRSNSYMFYKEQLINRLEPLVPPQYTKLVMLDGDILFDTPDWLDHISMALEKYDIVQPFSQACWLSPDNTIITSKKYGYGYVLSKGIRIRVEDRHAYHPGFAWAFRRSVFRSIGGFYDRAIVGAGDMMFACTFLPREFFDRHRVEMSIPSMIAEGWEDYRGRVESVAPKVGYIDIKALHLFHGLSGSRQYRTRYKLLLDKLDGRAWDSLIEIGEGAGSGNGTVAGLYQFKDVHLRNALLEYFRGRDEDIPLEEAMAAIASRGRAETRRQPARPRLSAAAAAAAAVKPIIELGPLDLPPPPSTWGINMGNAPPVPPSPSA